MARKKKLNVREQDDVDQAAKKAASAPVRESMFECHVCKENKPMAAILAIQNNGPLCKKCGGYDK
jgi:hypothetical protein